MVGSSVRRALLPGWTGPPARLAQVVCGLGALILVAELLGCVGEFRRWPVVATSVGVGAASAALGRRRPRRDPAGVPAPPGSRVMLVTGAVAVAAVVSRSLQASIEAWHAGMTSYDTVAYHLPFAARFFQDGRLTHLQYAGNPPTSFYPANGELVHAIGMLLFRSDVLSPALNIGWLGLALLAGWCVGRPYGVAPATMTATAVAAFLPEMGAAQAGTAGTDVAVLALLVGAVALVVTAGRARAGLGIAALAAGLAAGTKLDAWATVVALGVMVVVVQRGRRATAAGVWIAGAAIGSGFWYLRNLVLVGNPFPWFGAGVGLSTTTPPPDCGTTSIGHYLVRPGFLAAHIYPELTTAFGARWWLVLALAGLGTAASLAARRPLLSPLAAVALASAVGYLFTPATAGGRNAACFAFNTRFATPALALGLMMLPLAVTARKHGALLSVALLAIALVLTAPPSHQLAPLVAVALAVACACVVGAGVHRSLARPLRVAVVVAAAVCFALGGRHEQQAYARDRYIGASFSDPVAPIAGRLHGVRNARIAVEGIIESYPLYGPDLSNRVDYPARRTVARFAPYASCRAWLTALHDGRYDYAVTAREGAADSVATEWTRRYPGVRELVSSGPGATNRGARWTWQLFQLDPTIRLDPVRACAG